ncbi:hypothetical protein M407DRAFT_27868 [Tulasnella calospora MUT 4182]|uniref:Uncharacterized protein n=1 Tax=Tulasnella calospora MUT 4182 TaxID=1051891 RepID=A0A0C3QBP3_9AGAM|nr:hypothetical protein M407DRAFT_27868 [Tulasnella calospora MUT 4182]
MVQSLLKSLFLYSALAASAVLAAPAHHQSEPLERGVVPREYLRSPYPLTDGLTAPISEAISKRSLEQGGGPKKVTNGMRIANGLPPLAPRKLYHASPAGSAHKPRGSPALPVGNTAILVYGSAGRSGAPLGYVSKNLNSYGDYFVTTKCAEAMINPQLDSGALTNPANSGGYSNIGFLAYNSQTLPTALIRNVYMGGMSATPSGSSPVLSTQHSDLPGQQRYMESNVWSLGANSELIPTWINPDGKPALTELGYKTTGDTSIFISGGVAAAGLSSTPQIRLFLTDNFTC